MERVGEWRVIESEQAATPQAAPAADEGRAASSWRRMAVVTVAAIVALAGAAIWLTLPEGGVRLDLAGQAGLAELPGPTSLALVAPATPEPPIVVDVQGAVAEPGVHELPAGSRVADAIAAAGGYSVEVDIAAAAQVLNLAERLTDGVKIHVPQRGQQQPQASAAADVTPPGGGLIDVNRASATELESLPGIGPVTAAKIIAARQEQPFTSIDELDARDVVGPSTLAEIRDLITVAP